MTDTFTSDSGVKYDIGVVVTVCYPGMKWKHTGAIKSIKEWNDGSITYDVDGLDIQVDYEYIQKSSQSLPVQEASLAPTESEKQDFGKSLITFMRNEGLFDGNIGSHQKIKNFLSSNGYL